MLICMRLLIRRLKKCEILYTHYGMCMAMEDFFLAMPLVRTKEELHVIGD